MGLMDIGGGLGGFVGGILGNSAAAGSQAEARKRLEDALAAWKGLSTPDLQKLLTDTQAGQSAASGMDPTARGAQMDALAHLQDVYQTGGLTTQDRVAQEQAMQAAANQERAQRGAIMQDMAARGQAGGGNELAARMMAQQGGAMASNVAGSNAAAAAQQRALQAMTQTGQAAGGVRSQDLAKAQAQDIMSQFNAAQRGNAYQTDFSDRLAKTQGISGTNVAASNYYNQDAQRTRNQYTGMGQGLGASLGEAGTAYSMGLDDYLKQNTKKQGGY